MFILHPGESFLPFITKSVVIDIVTMLGRIDERAMNAVSVST